MAHYAYNMLKMPTEWGVLTVKADTKDAVFCVEQIYKAVAVSEPAAEPGSSQEDEPGSSTQEGHDCCTCMPFGPKNAGATLPRATRGAKRPREAPGGATGTTPTADVGVTPGPDPGKVTSVAPPRQQKLKGEKQLTRRVPLSNDAARCVAVGTALSPK